MCGRYAIAAIAERDPSLARCRGWREAVIPNYNVAPAQRVPIIRWDGRETVAHAARWGFSASITPGDAGQRDSVNARAESMCKSPLYRNAWKKSQRCLIPATGFYEWQVAGDGMQPYYVTCADQSLFTFAGLWDAVDVEGEAAMCCAIITLPASSMMADIHNVRRREPAILRREDWGAWLRGSSDMAMQCLRPYQDELRAVWPVSNQVNSPLSNGEALVRPVPVGH